jgi:hypothetical protein
MSTAEWGHEPDTFSKMAADAMKQLCHCGQPLHYASRELRRLVERTIAEHGVYAVVAAGGRSWLVPRHYIALHGVNVEDILHLGFKEVARE